MLEVRGLTLGSPTVFDAAGSTDSEGRVLSSTLDISGLGVFDGPVAAVLFDAPGTYPVTLTLNAGDDSATLEETVEIIVEPAQGSATVHVHIVDEEGAPVADIDVFDEIASTLLGTTDASGLVTTPIDRDGLRTLSAVGEEYALGVSRVRVPAGVDEFHHRIALTRRGEKRLLPLAEDGGRIESDLGAVVEFQPGSIVDEAGQAISGTAVLQFTSVDASREQGKAFPGGFDAFTEDGTLGILGSYGPTEFHLTDASGNRLNIDPSMPALIEMPLSIEGPNVGDEIPVWSLDETFGVWVSEGVGEVVASADSPTGRALRASVTHFSWWNPDVMLGEQRLIELVVDGAGNAGEPTGPGGDEGQPVQVRARSNGAFEAFFDSANAELLTGFDTTIANGVPATVSVAPGSLDVEAWSLDGRFRYDGPITIREVDQDRETLNLFDVWEEAQPFVHLLKRD
ncbi:MAG: hypothetical protein AAFY60_12555, partial [Myxococcota bacterium]